MSRPCLFVLFLAVASLVRTPARAYDCPGPLLQTLPDAREGTYPPDRIVLWTSCTQCAEPPALEVTLEGERVDGVAELAVTGPTAWLVWRPDAPLQVGLHYDLFVQGFLPDFDFHGVAFIRPADGQSDGRGADAFRDIEWALAETLTTVQRACCYREEADDCTPVCDELLADRPRLEASGAAVPWFVYWISTEDANVAADSYAPPASDPETPWHLWATLVGPSDSLCIRISARNLLTDETDEVEHCAATDPSSVDEPGTWTTNIVQECPEPPGIWRGATADPMWAEPPDPLVSVWCGDSLRDCRALHSSFACTNAATSCEPFWAAAGGDEGMAHDAAIDDDADAGRVAIDDDAGCVAHSSAQASAGCSVSPSPHCSHWFAWPIAVALLLLRAGRRARS